MQLIRSILQYLQKGYSYRRISQELKVNRKPVTSYARLLQASGYNYEELRQLSDAELACIVYPDKPPEQPVDDPRRADFISRVEYFTAELKRTGVTRLLLWEEYRKENLQGYGYTQFCILLKQASLPALASMRQEHRAGELVMVDFAGDELQYVDRSTGEINKCPVLVAVLPFSDFAFVIALPNATLPLLIKALNQCLEYFGGIPQALKTDNMKQVVSKPCRYEPLFTEGMQQWANFYNITLLTARIKKPKDKAAVENEVRIAYRRIYAPLRDKVFYSLIQLNQAIAEQLDIHNNKTFQGKDYSRRQLYEQQEKLLLQLLPAEPFIIKHKTEAKVQKNYHITLGEDWHHYSVPYTYIGKTVQAVYDTDVVEIYYQLKRIALHKRSYKRHGFTTTSHHMPEGHQHYYERRGWTPEYFLEQAARIGPQTVLYIQALLKARQFTEQTYNACRGLLRLQQEYGVERLEAACSIGLTSGTYNYKTIHTILVNNQDKITLVQTDLFRIPQHTNLRGPDAYQ